MKKEQSNYKCLIGIKTITNSILENLYNPDVSLM